MTDPEAIVDAVREEVGTVLIGNEDVVEGLAISMLTGGHVLLEGVPGVAKTTIANLFARTTGLDYQRIQMTPDVLPADITGTHIYRENVGEFELQRGPIFANIVVADEINRATPKTQSALLEAMQEQTVTIEGDTLELPRPFMVIATQNPIEQEGTFELPEAQRDRFQLKYIVDLPPRAEETELLRRFDSNPGLGPDSVEQTVSGDELLDARETVSKIHVDEKIHEYILDIVAETRETSVTAHGASPRASLAFLNAGKARAAIHGREYVIPDDIKSLAPNVLIHRLILGTEAELSGRSRREVVEEILESVTPPRNVESESTVADTSE
ncbi:MoxR-like ATPase [Halogranum gelatinilyticum]|uniref:MoxR-like ATPase n=1 Tax=Halogranum gelatinilyticum TaxID=660521 RepID=A0A1G9X7K8_9EURY|nr:MoxR family ATPase [Halogranum gelatinilyticum]SDM92313.1 MoxR-like ATPase [Halogranum gelatinilyticum]